MLTSLAGQLKDQLKRQSPAILRWVGIKLLSKAQTEALLQPAQISYSIKSDVHLPEVTDAADSQKVIFPPKTVELEPDFVWDYTNHDGRAELLRCGIMRIGNQYPDTDFGNGALLTDLLSNDRRPVEKRPLLIAPWSHYWGGYFDYVLFVAAKLCRIKAVLSPADFAGAVVSYPFLRTSFEPELLALLGIGPERLFDSRHHAFQFDRCVLANNSSWFYPAAADILALKATVEAQLPPVDVSPDKRLYISRSGRRKVLNEEALVSMLERYGFEAVEDKPRSIIEQIRLYQRASFIVGPHGASFANLLWCRPGTQLLELFPPNYRPEFFRYLTHVLDIHYAAYCFGPVADSHHTNVDVDVSVDVDEVERAVVKLLSREG
jgi:hypothetical protein